MEHITQIIDQLRSKGLFREFLSGIVNKFYTKYFLTNDSPVSTKERLSTYIEATQLTPDLLRIDWLDYDIIKIFLNDVLMMTQKPIDLWLSLARIINGHDPSAIINEQFMDVSLKRSVKTYLIKRPVGDDYSLYFFILFSTEDLKDALIIDYVEEDMKLFSKAQEKAMLPLIQKDKSLRELEMNNLREKSLVKKAKQALLEEQERKDKEYEERMVTTEFRKHKELAEFKKYKAVSKHQVIFNYIDRERQAEHAVVKDKVLPTGLGDDHIWLNIPHDLQEHSEVLTKGLSKSKITHRIKRDVATHHYSINITSLDQLQAEVIRIANEELNTNPLFKMNLVFGYTLEQPTEDGPYNYINVHPNPLRQLRAPMFIRKEHAEDNLQTFNNKIQDDLLHLYEIDYQTSSVKPVCVYKAILLVYLVSHLAGPIVIPEELIAKQKHQCIDTYQDPEFNLCFWYASYKFTSGDDRKLKDMSSEVKNMCYKFCNPKATHIDRGVVSRFLREYPGFDLMKDIQRYMDMYKHNVLIYETLDNKTFKLVQRHIYNNDAPTMRLLMISGPLKANPKKTGTHMMLITNLDGLTGKKWCSQCHNFFCTGKNAVREMENHMKNCKGVSSAKLQLQNHAKFYLPHILKNKVLQYLVSHKHCDLMGKALPTGTIPFTVTQGYITYDFETMEEYNDEAIAIDPKTRLPVKHTIDASTLRPLSIAMTVRTETTKTFYYDLRNGDDFIEQFLDELFRQALLVKKYNLQTCALYKYLSEQEDVAGIASIYKFFCNVKVLGYNSSKFDSHFLLRHLMTGNCSIKHTIGSASAMKSIKVLHKSYDNVSITFVDAMNYLGPGIPLKQFCKDFSPKGLQQESKGVFPYDLLNTTNYKEVLGGNIIYPREAFYNSLKKEPLPEEEYNEYVTEYTQMVSKGQCMWDYLQKYNEKDTQIMIPALDNYIQMVKEFGIDLLQYISLSSYACSVKYAMCYQDFSIDGCYNVLMEDEKERFYLTKEHFQRKCAGYVNQDMKKKLPIENDVSMKDYEVVKEWFQNGVCCMCGQKFTKAGRFIPTLDRIDNDKPHTIDNCQPCCCRCNVLKSNKDEHLMRLWIQLDNYCHYKNLPCNISKEHSISYHMLRKGITGGLSNVFHRENLMRQTHINKFRWNSQKKSYESYNTPYVQTHISGIDFNSLYPSAFSSHPHEHISRELGWADGRFFMPGRVLEEISDKKRILSIINKRQEYENLYVVEVKGYIPEERLNDVANFPPILRNYEINLNKETIGNYMYRQIKDNKGQKTEKKLTNLSSTMGTMMSFTNYYLIFLMDMFDFKITEVGNMTTFNKHTAFNPFVSELTKRRQEAILRKDDAMQMTLKIMMNGCYGYDIKNDEHFTSVDIVHKDTLFQKHMQPEFRSELQLTEDKYQVISTKKSYGCDTPLQEGFFTLDIAKVWYLNFIYNFMNRCLDQNRFHFCEGDTDSMYFSVSGNPEMGIKQGLDWIVKDQEYYNKNYHLFLPDESITDKLEKMVHKKKLLGACYEHEGENMICLGPKCYTLWSLGDKKPTQKSKGFPIKTAGVTCQTYSDALYGQNYSDYTSHLQFLAGDMHKVTLLKVALSGRHTKMIVQSDHSCLPFPPVEI